MSPRAVACDEAVCAGQSCWFLNRLFVWHSVNPPTGPGVLDYTLGTEEHKCKKDALLGRIKHPKDKTWKLIRPRPTKNQYIGPYYICKGILDVEQQFSGSK